MAKVRKKVDTKAVDKPQPKVRERTSKVLPKTTPTPKINKVIKTASKNAILDRADEDQKNISIGRQSEKYVKLYTDASVEQRAKIIAKVGSREIMFSHYGADGDKGVYYYTILNK